MMGSGWGGWVGSGYGIPGVGMILVWVVVIALAVLVVRAIAGSGKDTSSDPGKGKTALQILEERYARGEIEHEEFEQKRRDLSK
jgi:putative membrane protein